MKKRGEDIIFMINNIRIIIYYYYFYYNTSHKNMANGNVGS